VTAQLIHLEARADVEFRLVRVEYCKAIYSATLVDGHWPSDADLIDMADGGGAMAAYFGGNVENTTNANVKLVTVFND
jgi:hypothetical protein